MWAWRAKRKQLSCQEVVALVTDYLDGALKPGLKRRFEMHLDACLACPEYVAQIQAVALLAGRPDPSAPPPPSEAEALELFRRLQGGAAGAPPQP